MSINQIEKKKRGSTTSSRIRENREIKNRPYEPKRITHKIIWPSELGWKKEITDILNTHNIDYKLRMSILHNLAKYFKF